MTSDRPNEMEGTSQKIGAVVGLDPMIISGLILALIQLGMQCIRETRPDPNNKRIVTSKNIVDWLNGRDGVFGTQWLLSHYRKMRMIRQVEFFCIADKKIPNEKVDLVKEEFLKEVIAISYDKMENIYVNAGIKQSS